MDAEFVDEFARRFRRRKLFEPTPAHVCDLGRPAIERLVPHRPPFLFVDRISALDRKGRAIAGTRHIDPADPVFAGHFPGDPVYPGALQLETMGQLGLCLLAALMRDELPSASDTAPPARAIKIHHAAFREAVLPGDDLFILAKLVERDEYTAILAGQLLRRDSVCSLGVMEVYFVPA